jgi:hypothetical protein
MARRNKSGAVERGAATYSLLVRDLRISRRRCWDSGRRTRFAGVGWVYGLRGTASTIGDADAASATSPRCNCLKTSSFHRDSASGSSPPRDLEGPQLSAPAPACRKSGTSKPRQQANPRHSSPGGTPPGSRVRAPRRRQPSVEGRANRVQVHLRTRADRGRESIGSVVAVLLPLLASWLRRWSLRLSLLPPLDFDL